MAEAEASTNGTKSESSEGDASTITSELHALVDRLETRVKKLATETGEDAIADGRRQIQENPITAVLIVLGLGLLFGVLLGSRRG